MLRIDVNVKEIGTVTLPTNNLDLMADIAEPAFDRFLSSVGSRTVTLHDLKVTSTWPYSDTELVRSRLKGLTFDEVNDFAWELTNSYDPEETEQKLMYELPRHLDQHPVDLLIMVNDGVYEMAV